MESNLSDPKAAGHGSELLFRFHRSDGPFLLHPFTFQEFYLEKPLVHKVSFYPKECFYLIYCWSGRICCLLNEKNKRLSRQESCLIYDPKGTGVRIAKDEHPSRAMVLAYSDPAGMQRETTRNFFHRYKKSFLENVPTQHYFIGTMDLALYSKVNALLPMEQNEPETNFLLDGMFYEIYGLKMVQLLRESHQKLLRPTGFTAWEMEQIKLVSEGILQNPGREYSIESLCRESGLGPNKLQKGFRLMFNRSVTNYIRDMRLEKAVVLLRSSNLTITQIVYDIGLRNRSYFSKIFKQKYQCSPKDFQKTQQHRTEL